METRWAGISVQYNMQASCYRMSKNKEQEPASERSLLHTNHLEQTLNNNNKTQEGNFNHQNPLLDR